jgi:hypothetical protein
LYPRLGLFDIWFKILAKFNFVCLVSKNRKRQRQISSSSEDESSPKGPVKRRLFVEDEDGHGDEEKENAEPARPKRFCLKKFSSLANMDVSGEEEDTGESENGGEEEDESEQEDEGEEEESTGDEDGEDEEEDDEEADEMRDGAVAKYFMLEASGPK